MIDGNGPNLLGRDWLAQFKINLTNVYNLVTQNKLDQVLNKHSQVFKDGLGNLKDELGNLKDVKVKLANDPTVTPKFHKARSLPFASKEKVKLELKRLEEQGIISPVTHSDWTAPIVPVMKQNYNVITT